MLSVKNTFLNFDVVKSQPIPKLNRSSSDPLFETRFHEADDNIDPFTEIVMSGLEEPKLAGSTVSSTTGGENEDSTPVAWSPSRSNSYDAISPSRSNSYNAIPSSLSNCYAAIVMSGLEKPKLAGSTVSSTTGDEYEDSTSVGFSPSRSNSKDAISPSRSNSYDAIPASRSNCSDAQVAPPIGDSQQTAVASAMEQNEARMELKQELERLALENKRLLESNRLLKEAGNVTSATMVGGGQTTNAWEANAQAVQGYMWVAVPIVSKPVQPMTMHEVPEADNSREPSVSESQGTTVMLRNLPNNYDRVMVADMLDSNGFLLKYDFLYLPIDFDSRACLGYAFVNLIDPADAPRFWSTFDGFIRWNIPSKKKCYVSWSNPYQGLQANIERYRNSPVMHESVPEAFKPQILENGKGVPFPPATRKLRPPRPRR